MATNNCRSDNPARNQPLQPRRIVLIRHAQSTANAGGRTTDPAAILITALGAEQAEHVARRLIWQPRCIIVSRYIRTKQTASPFVRRFPHATVEEWPIEEFTYLDPQACAGTTFSERRILVEAYWRRCDPFYCDAAGCESFAAFIDRMRSFRYRARHGLEAGDLIGMTHGYVIKALVWLQRSSFDQMDAEAMADFAAFRDSFHIPNCSSLEGELIRGELLFAAQAISCNLPENLRSG